MTDLAPSRRAQSIRHYASHELLGKRSLAKKHDNQLGQSLVKWATVKKSEFGRDDSMNLANIGQNHNT